MTTTPATTLASKMITNKEDDTDIEMEFEVQLVAPSRCAYATEGLVSLCCCPLNCGTDDGSGYEIEIPCAPKRPRAVLRRSDFIVLISPPTSPTVVPRGHGRSPYRPTTNCSKLFGWIRQSASEPALCRPPVFLCVLAGATAAHPALHVQTRQGAECAHRCRLRRRCRQFIGKYVQGRGHRSSGQ